MLLALMMLFSMSSVAFAAESTDAAQKPVTYKGEVEYSVERDIILQNVAVISDEFVVITTDVSENERFLDMTRAYPEKEKTKVFSHRILDRNGIEMAVLYSTVTGIYSEADNEAYLTSITGTFTGDYASRFSYSSSIEGNTGSILFYFYGAAFGSFAYKIYTNGNIQNIS
jgi:hypothetical protein